MYLYIYKCVWVYVCICEMNIEKHWEESLWKFYCNECVILHANWLNLSILLKRIYNFKLKSMNWWLDEWMNGWIDRFPEVESCMRLVALYEQDIKKVAWLIGWLLVGDVGHDERHFRMMMFWCWRSVARI